jgi:hypothetical protein
MARRRRARKKAVVRQVDLHHPGNKIATEGKKMQASLANLNRGTGLARGRL